MAIARPAPIDGLDVNEVKDGLVVYEPSSDRVHYLNASAAIVFSLCDGERTVDDIARLMAGLYELDRPPRVDVEECIATFARERLLR